MKIQTRTMELAGTSREIGWQLGKMMEKMPSLKAAQTSGMEGFGLEQSEEAVQMFDRWCPGLSEELAGFAEALEVKREQVLYYAMTYLLPRCSQVAVLPNRSADGKPLLARNYEFHHEFEDFCLVKTAVQGKYTHLGTSVMQFGREEGVNEHGLAVTMSSCSFPVGPLPYMRAPKLKGLQYWAVIRALLENCKNVGEALHYLEGMPISFNLNLILLDKGGHGALVETLDGRFAVQRVQPDSPEGMLYATNHPVLPELIPHEPQAMVHSLQRYQYIEKQLKGAASVTREKLKSMLLAKYPEGLCCHYFEEFFGTTKSLVISPTDGTVELCWGGRKENGWRTYDIAQPLKNDVLEVEINLEKMPTGIGAFQPLI